MCRKEKGTKGSDDFGCSEVGMGVGTNVGEQLLLLILLIALNIGTMQYFCTKIRVKIIKLFKIVKEYL